MEDLPPFSNSLTAQLATLQRGSIDEHIMALTKDVGAIAVMVGRQDERSSMVSLRLEKIEKTLADVQTTTNRYKGGIAVILGASAFLTGILVFWNSLIAKFH